jgi:hypothetical protein
MSLSYLDDTKYWLQPDDLQGHPRRILIANVTFQGLEEAKPVLHFAGQSKRLVLTPDHCRQLLELSGSTLFADWIGRTVVLHPPARGQEGIRISSSTNSNKGRPMPVQRTGDQQGWRMAWTVVGVIAGCSAAYLVLEYSGLIARALSYLP